MSIESRRHRFGPVYKTHERAHHAVVSNEKWFTDGKPVLGKQFTVANANQRKNEVIDLLFRAATRERKIGNAEVGFRFEILADKLHYCRLERRCGSLACTHCHRAFQKAKVAAQIVTIKRLSANRSGKKLVMVSLIPLWIRYTPEELADLEVRKLNRWLKDALTRAGFRRVMLGSIDFSWEDGFYQPHWHIAMWTYDQKKLTRRLKVIFPSQERGDRPVMASRTYNLSFLPYKDKAIKLPALLRNNRRGLPHLLLALDRTDPLELMVLFRIRINAQDNGLEFKKLRGR